MTGVRILEDEETRLKYIAFQKRRYPCFECKYLISSNIYTTMTDVGKRPSMICSRRAEKDFMPDTCGLFVEGTYQECIKKPNNKKPWGV